MRRIILKAKVFALSELPWLIISFLIAKDRTHFLNWKRSEICEPRTRAHQNRLAVLRFNYSVTSTSWWNNIYRCQIIFPLIETEMYWLIQRNTIFTINGSTHTTKRPYSLCYLISIWTCLTCSKTRMKQYYIPPHHLFTW